MKTGMSTLKILTFAILVIAFGATSEVQPDDEGIYFENEDSENIMSDDSFTKDHYRAGVKTGVKTWTKNRKFVGGCTSKPNSPINGQLRCSFVSGCVATCFEDYKFPNGADQLLITCQEQEWHIQATEWNSIPHCEPVCLPECQNNGICVAPNQCNCPENFSGPQCQFENNPCLNFPPLVPNSQRQCSSKSCTVACLKNFVFPDGSAIANLVCKNGNWVPTRSDWVTIPECLPVCDPPCENGGNCLALNICQCPQEFRGPQCQYSASACSADKIGFNGGYYCTGLGDKYSCTLNCPVGIDFEFPPAATYTCTYDKGVFEPQPIPQCKIQKNFEIIPIKSSHNSFVKSTNHSWSIEDVFGSFQHHADEIKTKTDYEETFNYYTNGRKDTFGSREGNIVVVDQPRPEAKTCFTWGGIHYKTFDGKILSFESDCAHVLVQDSQDGVFTITVRNNPDCKTGGPCSRVIKVYIQGKEYTLMRNGTDGPVFRSAKSVLPIPGRLPGIRVETAAQFILLSLDLIGLNLKWDGALLVQVEATESLWNKTVGLCGTLNGFVGDDLVSRDGSYPRSIPALASSWRADNIGETCDEKLNIHHSCLNKPELGREATEFCSNLLSDRRFSSCSNLVDPSVLIETCKWDYCSCTDEDKRKCACDTMNMYVRQCAHKGLVKLSGWRNNDTCPLTCTGGRVYMSCGPKNHPSCGMELQVHSNEDSECEEGCFCPEGSVLHDGKCISAEECPCTLRGKRFKPGTSVPKDCNTCTCSSGKWVCTQTWCSARCAAIGDPHYVTFDGKRFDFMGKCSYYLVKGDNYSIQAENVACSGAISQSMGLAVSDSSEGPSCTKTVTIHLDNVSVKLKQNHRILINGEDVSSLPILASGVRIRSASSVFIVAHLPNGLEIWWDGISRVYVNAPPEFRGKTKGLCGTFTSNQKDDFLTPDGDVEQSVAPFANKWKTSEQCPDVPKIQSNHPCDTKPQKRAAAEKHCSKLHGKLFSGCHWYVDPESFYNDCVYDMCACETEISSCLCPILAAYSKECVALGLKVSWREEVEECRIHCPEGQVYQVCGNSCTRSCADISFYQDCKQECVEGCNCPEGETMDANGECIPIGQCPCTYSGLEFLAGHREVRPGTKGQELCTCAGGLWNCRLASSDEIRDYPAAGDLKSICNASKHLKVSTCEPLEHRTCRNMHEFVPQNPAVCKAGCVCKPGYVLDAPSGECVKEEKCPCYHGGKSYKEGSVMQEECNTCECSGGRWKCSDRICAGVCSAWGDSHYRTFDGKLFDFQGVCDYVLAKGSLSPEEKFDVSIQNVPCGTTGVSCSKSVTLSIGNGDFQEVLSLTRGKDPPKDQLKRIAVRQAGLFVFLDVPDLGLVLQWDRGTRVYVRLDPRWKGRTKGLCGDYNNNSEDDFQTPSGGIPEASANLFGDSWKRNGFCSEPKDVVDTCLQNPERKVWSTRKCGVLKSRVFQPCHSEVDVEPYIRNCVFDTCGCDAGGDCECLCTALAAYSHACNARGVPIKWRSQSLCPMQCDEKCSTYSPCVSTCPQKTCDNAATLGDELHLCNQDTCVEGCLLKPCPEGEVYLNSSYLECVPLATCKPFCLEMEGVRYNEGDKVKSDDCQTCYCSRGNVICKGEPCTTVPEITTQTSLMDEKVKCVDGWTAWLNRDVATKGRKFKDVEPLPTPLELVGIKGSAVCSKDRMIDIKCRSVKGHLQPKETGLNAECSLERGLYCSSEAKGKPCIDFEISVLCRCDDLTTGGTPSTTEMPTIPEQCDSMHPNKPHPTDCHAFYQCVPGAKGTEWIKKDCGLDLMYNPSFEVCDWPFNVLPLRPECKEPVTNSKTVVEVDSPITISTTTTEVVQKKCPEGETWHECAIRCNQLCHYYQYTLAQQDLCEDPAECLPGCVENGKPPCPSDKFWRDAKTCVSKSDCDCKSYTGSSVKPGEVVKESECETCQCINDFYTCDKSACFTSTSTTTPETPTTEASPSTTVAPIATTVKHLPSTVSPLEECESGNFTWMLQDRYPDVTLKASSSKNPAFEPKYANLHAKATKDSAGTWEPAYDDPEPWVEVAFPTVEPVYGVALQGSALENKFVTSYKVLFSEDGHTFSHVPDVNGEAKIFQGPVDKSKPVQQIFGAPIEAKIVRIYPQSWYQGVALRFDLFGCGEEAATSTSAPASTTAYTEKTISPVCNDSMGLNDGLMSESQVTVSSSAPGSSASGLKLSSAEPWSPGLDNPDQFVEFDFLEPRNLTGIVTTGGNGAWTTVFKVFYSLESPHWNPVTEDSGVERLFLGNIDDRTAKTNYFEKPVQARLLKLQPVQWHNRISMKAEILGCFLPFPPTTTPEPRRPPGNCNNCNGVSVEDQLPCKCEEPYWWDGVSCVPKQECPCVVGHMPYPVGSLYETEDCQQCMCTMGGIPTCHPKKCEPCQEPGLRSLLTPLCTCVCKPCEEGTKLCPTSNVCVNASLWCDGIENCPDDEKNCGTTTILPEITTPTLATSKPETPCEKPVCPPGYKVLEKRRRFTRGMHRFPYGQGIKGVSAKNYAKGGVKGGVKGGRKHSDRLSLPPHQEKFNETLELECPQFSCVSTKPPPVFGGMKPKPCPLVACPPDYTVVYQKMSVNKLEACPRYTCKPPAPAEVVCNVTGRTFNTFDGLEYKYDICNHILARDMYHNKWYITLEKRCDKNNTCEKVLVITLDEDVISIYQDLHLDFNEYTFTPSQTKKLTDKNGAFKVLCVGDAIQFISNRYGFWVIWNENANVKIGVTVKLTHLVDGLCGYLDGNKKNDRQKPDGSQAKSSVDFGNSWAMEGTQECEQQVCSHDIQEEAWKMCNAVKDQSLSVCSSVVNLEKFVSNCLETACTCLRGNSTKDDCRCRVLTSFVTECQAADHRLDLSSWRSAHDCPIQCKAPFVHKDCFRNTCEMTCDNLQEIDPCPVARGMCFSGCFCPDGLVRKGENCVPPSECRDCTCDGFGNSNYVNFDRKNFTFNGNCSYVLSRDLPKNVPGEPGHAYQVLVSNAACDKGICTEALTVLYKDHYVQIKQDRQSQEFQVRMDGENIAKFPHKTPWLNLERTPGGDVNLLIPTIQLEVVSFHHNFAFTVKLPSHTFGSGMEGLCGNCNGISDDDFRKSNGEVTEDINEFAASWLPSVELPSGLKFSNESCTSKPKKECRIPETHACQLLLNSPEFGHCHALVDPAPYFSACQDAVCDGYHFCDNLEAYARKCSDEGICVTWRNIDVCPYSCPPHLVYKPCGSGCKESCDTIGLSTDTCSSESMEGCFCPENQILHNDTCISKNECLRCDEEGHLEGDEWQVDKCTSCICSKKSVHCQKIECPVKETVCEENFTPVAVPGTEEECCTKYLCVPVPTVGPVCEEKQQPDCGFGQIMKVTTDSDGCQKFICECMPVEDCPSYGFDSTPDIEILEPGYVQELNTSGCCPRPMKICKPETCPEAPNCPKFYELNVKNDPEECCSRYKCNPPRDTCLYTPTSIGNDLYEANSVLAKQIGEIWKDGNCKTCSCEESDTEIPVAKCSTIECSSIESHPDIDDFVIEEVLLKDQCCPNYRRTACIHDGQIYHVGDSWYPDPLDPCVTTKCINGSNGVQKEIKTQECVTTCEKGYVYEPPRNKNSLACCGECKPKFCVVEDVLYASGDTWHSDDNCTTYGCAIQGDQRIISSSPAACPDISECPAENLYTDGCCQKCKIPSVNKVEGVCAAEVFEADTTIGMLKEKRGHHGICENVVPIEGLTECRGMCKSSTHFDPGTWNQESDCQCCQPSEYKSIAVELVCKDGKTFAKQLALPVSCSCEICSSAKIQLKGRKKFTKG